MFSAHLAADGVLLLIEPVLLAPRKSAVMG
jgi:hypothetical protein